MLRGSHGAGSDGVPRRGPRHASPSLLAPSRSLAAAGGLAVALALGIGGGAAASGTHGGAGGAGRAAAIPALRGGQPAVGPLSSASQASLTALAGGPSSSAPASSVAPDGAPILGLAASGIPITALLAYEQAATREAARRPSCGLTWPLLAGIGRVESDHGRFDGAVLHSDGLSTPPIIGIALNGHGTALIRDTDHGRLDGDPVYDHAVGPMQFIPSTWATWGVDANHDGVQDPFNIFDAAAAAADYLCAAGRNLRTAAGQVQAILSYNYSSDYVSMVMGLEQVYAHQVGITVPILPTSPGRPGPAPRLPPVNPGPPPAAGPPSHRPPPAPPHHPPGSPSRWPSTPSGPSSGSPSAPPSSPPSCPTSPSTTGSPRSAGPPAPPPDSAASGSGSPSSPPSCPPPDSGSPTGSSPAG